MIDYIVLLEKEWLAKRTSDAVGAAGFVQGEASLRRSEAVRCMRERCANRQRRKSLFACFLTLGTAPTRMLLMREHSRTWPSCTKDTHTERFEWWDFHLSGEQTSSIVLLSAWANGKYPQTIPVVSAAISDHSLPALFETFQNVFFLLLSRKHKIILI